MKTILKTINKLAVHDWKMIKLGCAWLGYKIQNRILGKNLMKWMLTHQYWLLMTTCLTWYRCKQWYGSDTHSLPVFAQVAIWHCDFWSKEFNCSKINKRQLNRRHNIIWPRISQFKWYSWIVTCQCLMASELRNLLLTNAKSQRFLYLTSWH